VDVDADAPDVGVEVIAFASPFRPLPLEPGDSILFVNRGGKEEEVASRYPPVMGKTVETISAVVEGARDMKLSYEAVRRSRLSWLSIRPRRLNKIRPVSKHLGGGRYKEKILELGSLLKWTGSNEVQRER